VKKFQHQAVSVIQAYSELKTKCFTDSSQIRATMAANVTSVKKLIAHQIMSICSKAKRVKHIKDRYHFFAKKR
jgi:hypothetical protein